MSPILIKGLIAAGGIGLGGVGIWQINEHMAPKTIQEKLEGEGKTFPGMDDGSLATWKTLFEGNNSTTPDNQKISLDGKTVEGGDNANEKKMRSACKKLMEKDLSTATDDEINRVRNRCTKPAT